MRHWQCVPRPRCGQRGSLLLWALGTNAVVLLFVVNYLPFFQTALRVPTKAYLREQSLWLAEAGIQRGLTELRWNNGQNLSAAPPTGGWSVQPLSQCDLLDQVADNALYGLALTSCHSVSSLVPVEDPAAPSGYSAVTWVANYGSSTVRVLGEGMRLPSSAENSQNIRRATVDLAGPPTFRHAAFGHTRLTISREAHLDSYDSTAGPYDPLFPNDNGDIGTNGDATGATDIVLGDARSTVKGRGTLTAGDTVQTSRPDQPTKGFVTESDRALPRVQIPASLLAISGYTNPPGPIKNKLSGSNGSYTIPWNVTWTCNSPTRLQSLRIDGVFQMEDGCELFLDPAGPMALPLDTNGSGRVEKAGTGQPARIYIRNGAFDLDGEGATFAASIPGAARRPELFQLYTTCTTPPCSYLATSKFAQTEPFYGVVYTEDGQLNIRRGSENGVSYDAHYHGAFVAGQALLIEGEDRDQSGDGAPESYAPRIHLDESLSDFVYDGTGRRGTGFTGTEYTVQPGSWLARQ